jgi:hypothetical protein
MTYVFIVRRMEWGMHVVGMRRGGMLIGFWSRSQKERNHW